MKSATLLFIQRQDGLGVEAFLIPAQAIGNDAAMMNRFQEGTAEKADYYDLSVLIDEGIRSATSEIGNAYLGLNPQTKVNRDGFYRIAAGNWRKYLIFDEHANTQPKGKLGFIVTRSIYVDFEEAK